MAIGSEIGKQAEKKIKEWLDRPQDGYSFDRLVDQMSGWYGSCNICDFICFKSPNQYYIESKATWNSRFDFSMISYNQLSGLLDKSKIAHCYGVIIVLFATHKRAFMLDIREVHSLINNGTKSLNIDKLNKSGWPCKYVEIPTIPNNRTKLLNYTGELDQLMEILNK